MVRIKLPRLNCLRCGHQWTPQQEEVNMCPKCKTRHWYMSKTGGPSRR